MNWKSTIVLTAIGVMSCSAALADEVVTIPAGCSIKTISVQHQHSENARVSFASDRGRIGHYKDDGQTGELYDKTGTITYKPSYPELFAKSKKPYHVQLGGQFSSGAWHPWVKSIDYQKEAVKNMPDKVVVQLFSGQHEDHNTMVTFEFARRCA